MSQPTFSLFRKKNQGLHNLGKKLWFLIKDCDLKMSFKINKAPGLLCLFVGLHHLAKYFVNMTIINNNNDY